MSDEKSYRPANGTEGMVFMEIYCERCERDARYRETDDGEDGCPIVAASMLYDIGEEGYPKEWVYGADGRPTCTAFEEELEPEARARRAELEELKRRGQGDLFGGEVQG